MVNNLERPCVVHSVEAHLAAPPSSDVSDERGKARMRIDAPVGDVVRQRGWPLKRSTNLYQGPIDARKSARCNLPLQEAQDP